MNSTTDIVSADPTPMLPEMNGREAEIKLELVEPHLFQPPPSYINYELIPASRRQMFPIGELINPTTPRCHICTGFTQLLYPTTPTTGNENIATPHSLNDNISMVKLKGRHIMKNIIDIDHPIDTVISLKDGRIGAHRIVLAAASPFLESLFEDKDTQMITLILPDITQNTMETLLNIAYTGKLKYFETEEENIFSAIKTLKFCESSHEKPSLKKVLIRNKPVPSPTPCSSRALQVDKYASQGSSQNLQKQNIHGSTSTPNVKTYWKILPSGNVQCSKCFQNFRRYKTFCNHLQLTHNLQDGQVQRSEEEYQQLTYCKTCDLQYNTISRAQDCLKKHHFSRCWICLGQFPKYLILDHYQSGHRDPMFDVGYFRCRWCPQMIKISSSGIKLVLHCISHHFLSQCQPQIMENEQSMITSQNINSRIHSVTQHSQRRRDENKTSSNTDKNYKRIRTDKDSDFPPYFAGFSETTGKIVLCMDLFPKVYIPVLEISQETLNFYTAKLEGEVSTYESSEVMQQRKIKSEVCTQSNKKEIVKSVLTAFQTEPTEFQTVVSDVPNEKSFDCYHAQNEESVDKTTLENTRSKNIKSLKKTEKLIENVNPPTTSTEKVADVNTNAIIPVSQQNQTTISDSISDGCDQSKLPPEVLRHSMEGFMSQDTLIVGNTFNRIRESENEEIPVDLTLNSDDASLPQTIVSQIYVLNKSDDNKEIRHLRSAPKDKTPVKTPQNSLSNKNQLQMHGLGKLQEIYHAGTKSCPFSKFAEEEVVVNVRKRRTTTSSPGVKLNPQNYKRNNY